MKPTTGKEVRQALGTGSLEDLAGHNAVVALVQYYGGLVARMQVRMAQLEARLGEANRALDSEFDEARGRGDKE